jgi:hypothetical protein
MADLQKGVNFTDGVSIANASNLNNLVDLGTILPAFISAKANLVSPGTGCELVVNDSGVLKKVTIANLATVITGGLGLDIHGLPAVTSLDNADEFPLWEDTAAANRKVTYGNLVANLQGDLVIDVDTGLPDILTGTRSIPGQNLTPAHTSSDEQSYTMTVTGASTSGTPAVFITPSIYLLEAIGVRTARVSAANTVSFSYRNYGDDDVDIANHTVRAVVIQF